MRIPGLLLLLACCATGDAVSAKTVPVATFSRAEPGSGLPSGWRIAEIAGTKPSRFRLVADAVGTVLEVQADASAASIVKEMRLKPAARWPISSARPVSARRSRRP